MDFEALVIKLQEITGLSVARVTRLLAAHITMLTGSAFMGTTAEHIPTEVCEVLIEVAREAVSIGLEEIYSKG